MKTIKKFIPFKLSYTPTFYNYLMHFNPYSCTLGRHKTYTFVRIL